MAERFIHFEVAGAELQRTLWKNRAPPLTFSLLSLPPSAAPVVLRKWLSAWQHFALVTIPCNCSLNVTCAGPLKFMVFLELYLGHIFKIAYESVEDVCISRAKRT